MPRAGMEEPRSAASHRARVLVADADRSHRERLVYALGRLGLLPTAADDGAEALALLESAPAGYYALVVAAEELPRLRGSEVLERSGGRAPFLLFAETDDPEISRAARERGARVARKPLDGADLAVLVEEAEAKRRSGEHLIVRPAR